MEFNISEDIEFDSLPSDSIFVPHKCKRTTNTQKEYISTLSDMPSLVRKRKPKAPTIFIIGGVVSLRDKLNWYSTSAED